MRTLLLAVSSLTLGVLAEPAGAVPTIFSFTGGFQTFTAPATAMYNILILAFWRRRGWPRRGRPWRRGRR